MEIDSESIAGPQSGSEFHRQDTFKQKVLTPLFCNSYNLIEYYHARDDRIPGKVTGERRMVRRNHPVCLVAHSDRFSRSSKRNSASRGNLPMAFLGRLST